MSIDINKQTGSRMPSAFFAGQAESLSSYRVPALHDIEAKTLVEVASDPALSAKVSFLDSHLEKVRQGREKVDQIARGDVPVYGINTGFGRLAGVRIPQKDLDKLQVNIIRSHACGVGKPIPLPWVRALLHLKLWHFVHGASGVRPEVILVMQDMLEHDVLPVIPSRGSVGASGDLAPLAHLALGMIGEGMVYHGGKLAKAGDVFSDLGIKPLEPSAKEGLALINGTHLMAVQGAFALQAAKQLLNVANLAGAMTLDALRGSLSPFTEAIHKLKAHPGQLAVARTFRELFDGTDEILASHQDCEKVQDPYSIRCIPQVHGASMDAIAHCGRVIETELQSISDNPLVLADGRIVSGGNFHGQAIAMAMDYMAIAVAELANISERRTEKLTKPHTSGQPIFLTEQAGLNSGFMIPQTVAAALVSENKVLCHPASVDSVPTNVDQEDHVSMGPCAGYKLLQVIENSERVLAIELLAAAQGIDLLAPLKPAPKLQSLHARIRKSSSFVAEDRSLSTDIEAVASLISQGVFSHLVQ